MNLLNEWKVVLRILARRPGLAVVAVVTLALGIGATSAVFSVLYGVLLRPLPYRAPERIVKLWRQLADAGDLLQVVSAHDYVSWKDQPEFAGFTGYAPENLNVGWSGQATREEVAGAFVHANFLEVLGVAPHRGRPFTAQEAKAGGSSVAIISHRVWQGRFAASANAVGSTLEIFGRPHTVIGVMPPGFRFPAEQDLWLPRDMSATLSAGGGTFEFAMIQVVARLRDGVSVEQAQTAMKAVGERKEFAAVHGHLGPVVVSPLLDTLVGRSKPALLLVAAAVAVVLLIACANVANLLLAHVISRERELAIRAALGAGRAQLARLVLSESVLISVAGGAAGWALAAMAVRIFLATNPGNFPRRYDIRLDGAVLGFAVAVTLLTGVLAGLAPVTQMWRRNLVSSLAESGAASAGGNWSPLSLRGALVVSEVALSLVLLISAGVLVHSFLRLLLLPAGFEPRNLIAMHMKPGQGAHPARTQAAYQRLLERLRATPGVRAATMTGEVPPQSDQVRTTFILEGQKFAEVHGRVLAGAINAGPRYFQAMSIALRNGRDFTEQDALRANVAVVNEEFERTYGQGRSLLHRQILIGGGLKRIVGIAADVRQGGPLTTTAPLIYQATLQSVVVMGGMRMALRFFLVVRTEGDAGRLVAAVRDQVQAQAPDILPGDVEMVEQKWWAAMGEPRFHALILGGFAAVALILAAIGIYGVIAYAVRQRTREIGVRMALGATERDIFYLFAGRGMALAALGVLGGFAGAFAVTHYLQGLLYGVSANDPRSWCAVALLLLAVSFAASYVPARRAARVDPMVALRYE